MEAQYQFIISTDFTRSRHPIWLLHGKPVIPGVGWPSGLRHLSSMELQLGLFPIHFVGVSGSSQPPPPGASDSTDVKLIENTGAVHAVVQSQLSAALTSCAQAVLSLQPPKGVLIGPFVTFDTADYPAFGLSASLLSLGISWTILL
ncbi:hypothetical protein AAY473_021584 [Plecturocebus cupreus]